MPSGYSLDIYIFLFLVLWNYCPWVLDATALVAKSTYERILRKLRLFFRLAKFLLTNRMLLTTIYNFVIIVHKIVCNSGNILSTFGGITKVWRRVHFVCLSFILLLYKNSHTVIIKTYAKGITLSSSLGWTAIYLKILCVLIYITLSSSNRLDDRNK